MILGFVLNLVKIGRIYASSTFVPMSLTYCLFVTACNDPDAQHRCNHNREVTNLLASVLSRPDKNGFKLDVKCCCLDTKSPHEVHYLLIKPSQEFLEQCFINHLSDSEQALSRTTVGYIESLVSVASESKMNEMSFLALQSFVFHTEDIELLRQKKVCKFCPTARQIIEPAVGLEGPLAMFNSSGVRTLEYLELVSFPHILHDRKHRSRVWRKSQRFDLSSLFPSVEKLRNYLGDSLGYYFNWLIAYCLLLFFPASASFSSFILTYLVDYFVQNEALDLAEDSADSHGQPNPPLSLFRIIYGFLTLFWALGCLKVWRRQRERLEYNWNETAGSCGRGTKSWHFSAERVRSEFEGSWRHSPITGELELYFHASSRRLRYLFSTCIVLLCFLVAIVANIILLNLEGYINEHRSPWIHFACFSCWAQEGELFDPNGNGWFTYLPAIIHPLFIFVMNQIIFRQVAERLTDFENHKTQEEHDRALVIKRFLFEAVDAYGCLMYLGLVLVDWNALQAMLKTMFATDSIRRITLECVIPFANYRVRRHQQMYAMPLKKRDDESDDDCSDEHIDGETKKSVMEMCADKYEPFDDYLEMVLQHGYLVLFAVANPPFVALAAAFCTWLETYTDMLKLLFVTQRPVPQGLPRGHDVWMVLLLIQTGFGLLTNIALLAARGVISYGGAFWIEHLCILGALLLEFTISNVPHDIKSRRQFAIYHKHQRFQDGLARSANH